MTNPFDPAPAPAPKRQGMSKRDVQLVDAITRATLEHHVQPLADRVAALERLLTAEQTKVADAIRDCVNAYMGDAPGDDDATRTVKAAMRANPEAYANDT